MSLIMSLKMLSSSVTVNARAECFLGIFRGDTAAASRALGNVAGAGALLEFLLGPLLGRFSDAFGRKPALLLAPLVTLLGNMLVSLAPASLGVHCFARVVMIAFDTAFFSAVRASQADVMSGSFMAQNAFMYMGLAGISVPLAPYIAGRLSPLNAFRLSAAAAGVASLAVVVAVQETLQISERLALGPLSACSPLAFLRLFRLGPTMSWLTVCSGLQTLTDYRLVEETSTLIMRDKLSWGSKQISRFLTLVGGYILCAPLAAKFSIKAFGRLGHTRFSNLANAVGYTCWARADSFRSMRNAQIPLVFGGRKRDGVETLMSDIGSHAYGMGKGELESCTYSGQYMCHPNPSFAPVFCGSIYDIYIAWSR